jgi:predicted transcriptional regulator
MRQRPKKNIAAAIDTKYHHDDNEPMDWSELIKRLAARGWLQTQIAERVGATQSTVSELLNGKTGEPRYSVAAALIALDESGEAPPADQKAAA